MQNVNLQLYSRWRRPWILQVFYSLLLFFSMVVVANAQSQSVVKGVVKDENGMPIPGANILLKGTKVVTSTDFDGKYTIQVTNDAKVLVYTFIGYKDKEVVIGNQAVINVKLDPSTAELKEVVVVGYGTQRKEAVTAAVASVSGDKMREVASANITQALQGRVSGVEFAQGSSKPGAQMQVRVRGTRSLNASNDPLVVLDGIPFAGSLSDINPTDIKSVDILKDASATAIYGSRGANGVILVTTNKGSKGQEAKINYTSYF